MRELIDEVQVDSNGYIRLKLKGELIRCGECKYHEVCKNGVNGWCNEHEHPTDVTYFCADGERKQEQ